MPRVSSYYGPLGSGSVTAGMPAYRGDGSIGAAIGDIAGAALGALTYDPARDPQAQQARYYGAQADKVAAETNILGNASTATQALGPVLAELAKLPEPERAPAAAAAMGEYMAGGGDPTKLVEAMLPFMATGLSDEMLGRFAFANRGTTLSAGNGVTTFSPTAQTAFVEDAQVQETALNDADNRTIERGQDKGLEGTMYSSDNSLRGTRYSADASAAASRYSADASAGASRYATDKTDARERDPTAKPTTVTETVTELVGGAPERTERAGLFGLKTRKIPAVPATGKKETRTTRTLPAGPRRIKFDAQGNPIP